MKQKIIIEVKLHCNKCRSKALMLAAKTPGVMSVALKGEKYEKIVIIGEAVDAAGITSLMRKKLGHASLELVDEINETV